MEEEEEETVIIKKYEILLMKYSKEIQCKVIKKTNNRLWRNEIKYCRNCMPF